MKDKNKIMFIICLFTGFFGGHCFVENKPVKGIIYLFTLGLFGFGWIWDLINYLKPKETLVANQEGDYTNFSKTIKSGHYTEVDVTKKLEEASKLRQVGAITVDEYEAIKRKYIDKI